MKKMKELFLSSSKEMKNLKCITLLSMLGAVSIILGYLTFMPSQSIKVTFNFLPNEFVYYLFGPVTGAFFGAAMDILTYILRPTGPFFYGFTISAILNGLLYGILLYKRPVSLKRILIANLIQMLTINLLLNTYWLSILYGNAFMVLLPARAIKAAIMLPIESAMLYTLIRAVESSGALTIFQLKDRVHSK